MAIKLKTELPGPRSKELMAQRNAEVARGPFHVTPIFISQSSGAIVEDVDGNRLLDFASGIGVNNVGHRSPAVLKNIQAQSERFLHAGFNVTPYESYVNLCSKLNRAYEGLPGASRAKSFLANSGAEAVENAIKIARAATGRQAIVCFDHAFHGRTYMALTLTAKYKPYKYGFGPYNSEVYRAPYPYAYRWPTGSDSERVADEAFDAFKSLVQTELSPTQVAAVIMEPVLGEGGFVAAPAKFMKSLREFCTANGILLIADEIQSGFGRTGKLFACEKLGIAPDLLVTAKGLGGGMPISAVTGRESFMDAPIEGGIGGTFGGNPLCCAAALAVFETFEKRETFEHIQKLEGILEKTLMGWSEKYSVIGDVRGLGLMRGIEFVKSRKTKEPFPEAAKAVTQATLKKGVITMNAGSLGNVIRLLMPLVISAEDFQEGLSVIESAISDLKV